MCIIFAACYTNNTLQRYEKKRILTIKNRNMTKWTKEKVEEIIKVLFLKREICVESVSTDYPPTVIVRISGGLSSQDLSTIGRAFSDEDIFIDAVGIGKFELTFITEDK
jgi:hypothetical protein|nr:MAG TPA: hypothetical protein [Caudoviricetes sp.]